MFGPIGDLGQLGGNAGPAISGAGSPVFSIASEQPSFLNDAPFFAGSGGGQSYLTFGVVAAAAAALGYLIAKK